MDQDTLSLLEQKIGVSFLNSDLLVKALTHRSAESDNTFASNERLEFLGDAIIGFVIGEYLFEKFPHYVEGELAKSRAYLVCEQRLADAAHSIDLESFVILGLSEDSAGGRYRKSTLSDALEALVAAVYLDQGLEQARAVIIRLLAEAINSLSKDLDLGDYKSTLQEQIQAKYKLTPKYHILSESGKDHDKTFVAQVSLHNSVLGEGAGRSKREAEQTAARAALENRNYLNLSASS